MSRLRMSKSRSMKIAGLILGVLASQTLVADEADDAASNWNNFRGPSGNGFSSTAKPPTQWSDTKNIAWKTAIPGRGTSSPVVWGDRVFLTTAISAQAADKNAASPPPNRRELMSRFDEDGDGQINEGERAKLGEFMRAERQKSLNPHRFVILCVDRNSGKVLWEKTAAARKPTDGHHQDHGYASASPVTDGKHVFASFGSNGLFCYDFDGNKIWERTDLGEMKTRGGFGEGSSPALFEDTLILPWDHEGQSRIETLDKRTGKTKWKVDRDEPSNWATPRVVSIDGKQQIIHAGENYSRGYDLDSGDEIWRSSGLTSRPVVTPVVKGNLGYFASGKGGFALNAYHLDRTGDISSQAAWKIERQTPDCPSLLLSENRLYFLSGNNGIISCANADGGSLFFEAQRLREIDGIYSSPVAADGKVFVTGRKGDTVVIDDAESFKIVQKNDIGEAVDATLALAGDQIFIRGASHLFCVQEK